MDTQIIAAVIGALAVIIAAFITVAVRRSRQETAQGGVTPRQLYLLGVYMAGAVWGEAPAAAKREGDLGLLATTTLERLRVPASIRTAFDSLLRRRPDFQQVQGELPRLKGLLVMYLQTTYGERAATYYALGFDIISAAPMLGLVPAASRDDVSSVVKFLNSIAGKADKLSLPTKELRRVLGRIDWETHDDVEALTGTVKDLMRIGDEYIAALATRRERYHET